jgi:type 1 glutamine amidotransferase
MRLLSLLLLAASLYAADAKVVLLAGKPSHPPGMHEYHAGMLLIQKWLRQNPGVDAVVAKGGWPADERVFDGAAAIVMFMDGGKGHAALGHLATLERLMSQGVGLGALHYGVDVPAGTGGPQFLEWLGGHYEGGYSRNPMNDAQLTQAAPKHPISAGWQSFALKDEWYYRIRFRPEDKRFTPILTTMLPKDAPLRETVAWVVERADGGRGFGFTGGHFHSNWETLELRRLVTNAILWIAKVPIPAGGARCDVTAEELTQNLDDKPAPAPRKKK